MTREEVKEMQLKLAVFSFGRLQELLTLFSVLEREEISLQEVRKFVEAVKELQKATEDNFRKMIVQRDKEMGKLAGNCPECKTPLRIRTISLPKGKANIHGYKSHYFCGNEECNYEKYSKESIKILVKKTVRR